PPTAPGSIPPASGCASSASSAAVSIPSNTAEGWGRRNRKDYSRFVLIARGSNDELQAQLVIAQRLGFGEATRLSEAAALSEEVGKMLGGLHKFLQSPMKCASTLEHEPNVSGRRTRTPNLEPRPF